MSHQAETRLTKLKHMSHQAEKVRDMSHQAEKGDQALATWKEHEASKPVGMVAMHYQLPFMISKCLLQSP